MFWLNSACARQAVCQRAGDEKADTEEPVCFWTWQLLCVLHTCMLTCSNPDPSGYSCSQPGLSIRDCHSADLRGGSYLQTGIKGTANKTDCLGTNGGCLRWKSSSAWKSAQSICAWAASDGRWVLLPCPCRAGQAGWAAGTRAGLRHHPGVVLSSYQTSPLFFCVLQQGCRRLAPSSASPGRRLGPGNGYCWAPEMQPHYFGLGCASSGNSSLFSTPFCALLCRV